MQDKHLSVFEEDSFSFQENGPFKEDNYSLTYFESRRSVSLLPFLSFFT